MIGALMLDIAGTELTQEDIELLRSASRWHDFICTKY
jgi:hypothetical protein